MAKFTKQHYQAIADLLKRCQIGWRGQRGQYSSAVHFLAHELSVLFELDNARFNRDHFLAVVRGERPLSSRPPRSHTERNLP